MAFFRPFGSFTTLGSEVVEIASSVPPYARLANCYPQQDKGWEKFACCCICRWLQLDLIGRGTHLIRICVYGTRTREDADESCRGSAIYIKLSLSTAYRLSSLLHSSICYHKTKQTIKIKQGQKIGSCFLLLIASHSTPSNFQHHGWRRLHLQIMHQLQ